MQLRKQRNSNLELLRIISMILIIFHHFVVHGMFGTDIALTNFNTYILLFMVMFGKLGVVIFILISAYFMIETKITLRKFLVLGGEVYFYSFLFLAIGIILLTPSSISVEILGQSLLPISHSGYWFITCYIILILFSPLMNKGIKSLSEKMLLKVILVAVILWSVFPTFIPPMTAYPVQMVYSGNNFQYTPLIWFFVIYLIGSYIRLYLDIDKLKTNKLIIGLVASILITYIGTLFFGYIDLTSKAYIWWSLPIEGIMKNSLFTGVYAENKFFILIASLCLFLLFLKRKEFSNKYINFLAGSALGVYLIHENTIVSNLLLWKTLDLPSYYNCPYLVLIGIILVAIIYIVCSGIDIIRRLTIEKLWIWIIDNKLNFLSKWIERMTDYIIEK